MKSKAKADDSLSFEQSTHRLEEIVQAINNPETGLEEMIALVEEGLGLIRRSRQLLARAELKIKTLEVPQEEPEAPGAVPAPARSAKKQSGYDEFSLL
ncbi:MAG: exodeoxyribonuclease VII small subunit [Akkermansia muciniphila]|nr:exodeoxyribonuclease VII small subunit [Akkermansia muciniphila]MDD6813611.1 exodeoxyribonuclease VII small subunit [Akkermansia muciniphila]